MSTVWIFNQYATTPKTGMGGRSHYLARELAKRGHKVRLHAARYHHLINDAKAGAEAPDLEQIDGYEFARIPTPHYPRAHSKKRILNWFLFSHRIARLHRGGERPDAILYSSPSLPGIRGAEKLARRTGASLAFEVRDIWPLTLIEVGGYSQKHPFIRYLQGVEDRGYRQADRVISNLPAAVDHMVTRGLDREKFAWVPNGFSAAEVSQPLPLSDDLEASLPKDGLIVGYAGSIGHANALDNLIEAAAIVGDRADLNIVLVGNGQEREKLQGLAAARSLTNIHFTGAIAKPQVPAMLSRFDVCYVGLTHDDLFRFGVSPNKLFDYMIAAKPILYAIDSGPYRPVQEAGAGLHVAPEDPKALAAAIMRLAEMSPDERAAMGANGKRAAMEQYEYGMLAGQLEQVLGL